MQGKEILMLVYISYTLHIDSLAMVKNEHGSLDIKSLSLIDIHMHARCKFHTHKITNRSRTTFTILILAKKHLK